MVYYEVRFYITIPSQFDNYTLTSIGSKAFVFGNFNSYSVLIPQSVLTIEENAFNINNSYYTIHLFSYFTSQPSGWCPYFTSRMYVYYSNSWNFDDNDLPIII
jgi:endo-1,4-beta-D-glucanase Y